MAGAFLSRREWALALAGALAGCVSQRTYAEERRVLIDVGMTGDEVQRRIGKPWKIVEVASVEGVADQTVKVWAYALNPGPGPAEVAVGLVLVAGVLLVAASGGGELLKGGGWSSGGSSAKWKFWVGFGPDGRVRGVTNLEKSR